MAFPAVFAILDSKHIRVTTWPFRVTQSHRVRDQLSLIPHGPFPILMFLWNKGSISNGFLNIEWQTWLNGSGDLKRLLNKDQGHFFGTNRFLISYTTSYRLSIATIHNVTDNDRRRTQHCSISTSVSTVLKINLWVAVGGSAEVCGNLITRQPAQVQIVRRQLGIG